MDKEIEEIIELLHEANNEYKDVTPNQLGMPSHLLNVASRFGIIREKVSHLEKICIKGSNRWMKNIYGYGNNSNNNNNNNTRKRKRNKA